MPSVHRISKELVKLWRPENWAAVGWGTPALVPIGAFGHRAQMRSLSSEVALATACGRQWLGQPCPSPERVAEDIVGLHNTTQFGPYLSVRARMLGFQRRQLERLMWDEWRLARFRAMRLTMFVLPPELLEIAAAATRHLSTKLAARWLRDWGMSLEDFEDIATSVEAALADGPLTVRELRARLGVDRTTDIPGVVGRLCDQGRLVGGAPPRHWRSTIRQYHRRTDVLPDVDLDRWSEPAAEREVIRRYVYAYGPVTLDDIAWWTGFTKQRCRTALEDLADIVEPVVVDGWDGRHHWVAPSEMTRSSGAVHALPMLDPYVQGYRDRKRFLAPDRSSHVYDRGGNATATIIWVGKVVGVWQAMREPVVRYHLFGETPHSIVRRIEHDLAQAGLLYFDEPVDVVRVAEMQSLSAHGGRSAAHPLDNVLHRASRRPASA